VFVDNVEYFSDFMFHNGITLEHDFFFVNQKFGSIH